MHVASTMQEERKVNNGSDLIVDFSRRRPAADGEATATATTAHESQVRFSEHVTVHCFQYPSRNEVSKRWHSKTDKEIFKQEMSRDVRSIRYLLSTTPMEAVEKEVLYECVGLEAHLSSQIARFLKEKRRRHTRLIVQMQDYLSEEHLSEYAESHSSDSKERAQKLAAGYSEILSK